jgi:hypothetical protein
MAREYSVAAVQKLKDLFRRQILHRPFRTARYDSGEVLEYEIKGVVPRRRASVKLEVERYAGGGYAGQVYRVKLLACDSHEGPIPGLEVGRPYALKILIPVSSFGRRIRNFIYFLGFQGPFSPQVNPASARAGALWQKFIRRGARIRFGSEDAIVDIIATLIDHRLGSCGELSEWVEGRLWRFEVDDNLEGRLKWKAGMPDQGLGSPEYRAKRTFMARLVSLMHEMGASELARQYEWWTCKSQPNALKRIRDEANPEQGLVAVDFRAGMVLLPFLPQCPADFKLIFKGIGRGSLVQFDRGNLAKLQGFVDTHPEDFADLREPLEELKSAEKSYRDSLPDIAHHHFKLLVSGRLWSSIMSGLVRSWRIRNLIDDKNFDRLSRHKFLALTFLGAFIRKLWGRPDYRRHIGRMLTSPDYFRRATRGRIAESLIRWHRAGRMSEKRALLLAGHPLRFYLHLPFSFLPRGLHRFLTDKQYFKEKLDYIFVRPVRLFFNARAREAWLRDMVAEGQKKGMLDEKEAAHINSQIKEPFIQKYLKSLAVHLSTLFASETIFLIIAIVYILGHRELSWHQATLRAGIIIGLLNMLPISPGSLIRGFYVLGLIIKERNFRDYNIAFGVSFLKMLGYLAFPIQMAYRYPDLARFMAGHWAIDAVHIVPVFGERGALLEHAVFDACYNYPLSIRRRMQERAHIRERMKPRSWHAPIVALASVGVLSLVDLAYFRASGQIAALGKIWWAAIWVPLLAGVAITSWAGRGSLPKRILLGVLGGILIGMLHALAISAVANHLLPAGGAGITVAGFLGKFGLVALRELSLFAVLAVIGVIIAETRPIKSKAIPET